MGWRVCGYFPRSSEAPWFDGVVVAYSMATNEHLVFYECDASWEAWVLPDPGLIYATVAGKSRGKSKQARPHPPHLVRVSPTWLPRRGKGPKGSFWG